MKMDNREKLLPVDKNQKAYGYFKYSEGWIERHWNCKTCDKREWKGVARYLLKTILDLIEHGSLEKVAEMEKKHRAKVWTGLMDIATEPEHQCKCACVWHRIDVAREILAQWEKEKDAREIIRADAITEDAFPGQINPKLEQAKGYLEGLADGRKEEREKAKVLVEKGERLLRSTHKYKNNSMVNRIWKEFQEALTQWEKEK